MNTAEAQRAMSGTFVTACVTALASVALACSLLYTPVPALVLAACAAAVYFFRRPYELFLVMVFLIPFNFVIRVGPVPLAAELLKVFIWIPLLVERGASGKAPVSSRFRRYVLVLAVLLGLSALRATDRAFSLKECVRLASDIGLLYVVPHLVDTREKLFQVLRTLMYSTLSVALYGFYQFAIHDFGALFWIVNPRFSTELAPGRSEFWEWRGRITSVLTSEMELGHYLNLCIPIGIVLWLQKRPHAFRWLLVTAVLLGALVLTFTFGAWASLLAAVVVFVALLRRQSGWKLLAGGGAVSLTAAVAILESPARELIATKFVSQGMGGFAWDVLTRLDNWMFALQVWVQHPLIGVGAGNFQALQYEHDFIRSPWAPAGTSPHETYLYILAQYGIIGFVSLLAIVLGVLRSNWRLRAHPRVGIIASGLAFALTVNLIGWFSDDSTFFSPHAGYLVWVVIGLSEAVRNIAGAKTNGLRQARISLTPAG